MPEPAEPAADPTRSPSAPVRSLLVVAAIFFVYVGALAVTWPSAFLVSDESLYVNQAALFADGTAHWNVPDAISTDPLHITFSDYPPGTSLVQAPFVALGGWRAAVLASTLALFATVLVLRRWLQREGRSPWFALLVLAHPTALVMGRVGMSDAPSMFLATAALALFWRGLPDDDGVDGDEAPAARRWSWPAAGALAGLSLLFREPNLGVFVPFVVGALVRRDASAWRLLAGVVAGAALRLAVAAAVFGDPLYVKPPGEYHGIGTQLAALGLLVAALVVFLPGGLVAVAAYRGRRRPEVIATVGLVVVFFAVYGYSASESGVVDRLVLIPRYALPLLPLSVFAMAEAVPRLAVRAGSGMQNGRQGDRNVGQNQLLARVAVGAVVAVAVVGSLVVAVAVDRRAGAEAEVARTIQRTVPDDARLVVNPLSLTKHLGPVFGDQPWADRTYLPTTVLPAMVQRPGPVYIVFLDRGDSAFRDREAAANQAYLDEARIWNRLTPVVDRRIGDGRRLRILKVELL